mmetsp:Transcript_165703/g.532008  ORF Transcript_165703/g.532008 Transcript_165703/m.532008 type:complete len:245 (-) Transcript_165703:1709-2443(-)
MRRCRCSTRRPSRSATRSLRSAMSASANTSSSSRIRTWTGWSRAAAGSPTCRSRRRSPTPPPRGSSSWSWTTRAPARSPTTGRVATDCSSALSTGRPCSSASASAGRPSSCTGPFRSGSFRKLGLASERSWASCTAGRTTWSCLCDPSRATRLASPTGATVFSSAPASRAKLGWAPSPTSRAGRSATTAAPSSSPAASSSPFTSGSSAPWASWRAAAPARTTSKLSLTRTSRPSLRTSTSSTSR